MSLVEDALKKLRTATTTVAAPVAAVVRSAAAKPAAAPVPAPARRQFGNTGRTVVVDMELLRRERLVPPEEQERQIAQQFRGIKRPLIKTAMEGQLGGNGAHPRLIMVSSALPGDGKTFSSINLALSLASERDYSVLLIDGDAAKPHVSRVFGVANEPGLLDLLQDASRGVESVVLPTSVPGLSILPSGRRSEGVSELLGSARMLQVSADLLALDPNLLVVVDSPPVLLTSEARVMASLFGQILLVVRSGATPQHAVSEALEVIGENAPVKLVLNEAVHTANAGYYGYGYGYQQYGDPQP